jgi:hypothetical protein
MCGKPLPEPTGELSTPVEEHAEQAPRHEPAPSSPAPAYTGGIFNLGAPSDRPYHDLDYLLDDDEPKSHKGLIFLGIIALALVAGLGWLRFRNIGLPDLLSDLKARASAKQPAQAPPSNPADSSPPANLDQQNTPAASTPPSSAAPAAGAPTTPPPSGATPTQAAPASNMPGTSPSQAPSAGDSNPAAATPTSPSPATADSSAPAADAENDKPAATPAPAKPADAPKPTPKPAPKPAPKPPDQVTLGEQYLYGRGGMPQNCERGLRYVKPAADQSNPKAMITMGALYATGHCLSRDLPTAYRYFALALRVDPENGPLRQNAEMVWKQMTAEERKQAIRLTQ